MKEIEKIKEKISASAKKVDKKFEDITVVCATKMQSISTVKSILEHGFSVVGENRVQELLSKYEPIKGVEWHFIGQLQSNKVKQIVKMVSLIHSVDRLNLAQIIDQECKKISKIMPVLVEVNISEISGRGGVRTENIFSIIDEISKLKNVKVLGLMTILPISNDKKLLTDCCIKMKELFFEAKQKCKNAEMKFLSMGMSDDYEIAIENGANMIRLGRALFGER